MKRKPVIAVDIDDVLCHCAEAVIEFSNATWGMDLTIEDYDEDWRKLWKLDPSDIATMHARARVLRDAEVIGEELAPRFHAAEVLTWLRSRARVVAVTSRRRAVEPATRRWINTHLDGAIEEIYFAGIFDEDSTVHTTHDSRIAATKHEILSSVHPDYFMDDQLKHCEAALRLGIKTIVFGDYAWNRDTDITQRGAVRCASWDEVKDYFVREGLDR